MILDAFPYSLGNLYSLLLIRVGQQDDKLFSGPPGQEPRSANALLHQTGNTGQNSIPSLVSIRIVHLGKVVDIRKQKSARQVSDLGAAQDAFHLQQKGRLLAQNVRFMGTLDRFLVNKLRTIQKVQALPHQFARVFGVSQYPVQVKKCYRRRRVVRVKYRMQWGVLARLKERLKGLGLSGKLNTAFVERVNLTLR